MDIVDPRLKRLADMILTQDDSVTFTILEIGGMPLEGETEPFHQLVDLFPGSRVLAFEVDKNVCERLNKTCRPGIEFFPTALGRTEETRTFYNTAHPMCSSLYAPNEQLIRLYNGMEVSYLASTGSVATVSMDHFADQHGIRSVDFIKIDIQGAELEVFQGGHTTLKEVLATVCEVEFVPLYVGQPLFGDVCTFLDKEGLMFHKFRSISGRTLAPLVIRDDPNFSTQHLWADAVFVRHISKLAELSSQKVLKLAMLGVLYGSPDLTFLCLQHYDRQNGTRLQESFLALASAPSMPA